MNSPQDDTFKLSKRVRLFSKLLGRNSAFELSGAKKLGQGAFGTVYSSKGVAVKVAHSKGMSQLQNEIEMLKEVRGSRVAPNLLGTGKGYAAIQKFEGKPLNEYLKKIKDEPVFADYIFRRIVEAVGSLHRKNVAQRDLHAGNIFITDNYEVKILDYGQAKKGYDITYFETFFGNNNDPSEGSLGLVSHLFKHTTSYKEYKRILINTIKNICKKKKLNPQIVLQNYETIEGDEQKESEYFDSLHALASHPSNDYSDVNLFYDAIDSALRINTKNPAKLRRVAPKSSLVSKNTSVTRSINRSPSSKSSILKFETGGVVPGQGPQTVELHGKELVLPKKAVKLIRKNGRDSSEIAIGTLIAYRVFPYTTEGIEKAKKIIANSEYWVVPSELPDYYDGIDSDIMVGKETPGISAITEILKAFYKIKSSAGVVDFVDTSKVKEEEIERKVDVKIPPAHYIEGQKARWQPEFESDFDHAVYFAGKSPLPKGAKQREVLEWLMSLGLTFQQIRDHREKVLEKIRETISLPGVDEEYPYVYIDEVEKDFELEDGEEEYDDMEDELEGLDELLSEVRSEDETPVEQVVENIEEEIVDAVDDEDEEDPLSDEDLEKLLSDDEEDLEGIAEKLLPAINKPKKESNYTTNKKIFDSIVANFGRIQATLNIVNSNLEKQNELIKASIETQLAIGELISNQTVRLEDKFDLILKQFEMQTQISKQQSDDADRQLAESNLEDQRDSAGTAEFQDLTRNVQTKKRQSRLEQYFRSRLTRKLYRKLPKSLRKVRQKVRKLQRLPGRMQSKALNRIVRMLPSRGKQITSALSKVRGAGGVARMMGPAKYIFAGMEYSERKQAGQSEAQALAGVGGGLAGAAAGAAMGAAIGSVIPGAGTLVGGIIGGLIGIGGALLGGMAGSAIADKITGAHETGTNLTKPGTALLHGTEAVINKDDYNKMSPMNTIGGVMIASTSQYINSLGPIASPIAPTFKSIASQMAREYDVPTTIAQTNAGGSLPRLGDQLQKIKERRRTPEEELSALEKDLLETQDSESFADKLLKMIDPEGKFQQLLNDINNRPPVGETGEGMATFGESGIPQGTGYNSPGWVHGHFQNNNKQTLINDTFDVVKKLLDKGVHTVITATNKDLNSSMTDDEIRRQIEAGIDGHKKYASGVYAIDVSVPTGTAVPFELQNVYDSKGPGGIVGTMKGRTTQVMHLAPGSRAGAPPSSTIPLPTAQGLGKQGTTDNKNFGSTSGVGSKGYLIVPGHAAGGGAPEEKKFVKQLAQNAYTNLKSKFPDANIQYQDTDSMFEDTDDGFKQQLAWFKQKEKEGWEILEIHMDASMESGQGTGRGAIVPTGELNPVEAYFAQNYGAFSRGHRDLGAPKRGVGLFELGNMSPELVQASRQNRVSKQQLDALTAPLERSVQYGLNLNPPASPQKNRFQSLQGSDNDNDTRFLIVNQPQRPNVTLPGGGSFVEFSPGRWKSSMELSTTLRNLYIQRLGQ